MCSVPRTPGLSRGRWSRVTRLPFPGDLGSIPLLGPQDWAEHPAAPSVYGARAALPAPMLWQLERSWGHTGTPPAPGRGRKVWRESLGDDSRFILRRAGGHRAGGCGVGFSPQPMGSAFSSWPVGQGSARLGSTDKLGGWALCASLRPFPLNVNTLTGPSSTGKKGNVSAEDKPWEPGPLFWKLVVFIGLTPGWPA